MGNRPQTNNTGVRLEADQVVWAASELDWQFSHQPKRAEHTNRFCYFLVDLSQSRKKKSYQDVFILSVEEIIWTLELLICSILQAQNNQSSFTTDYIGDWMLLFMAMKDMKWKIMATNHDTIIGADQRGV